MAKLTARKKEEQALERKPAKQNLGVLDRFLKKKKWCVLGILNTALFIVLYNVKEFHLLPSWDGVYYVDYTFDSVFPPGYPAVIFLMRLFTSDPVLAARFCSMFFLCGCVTVTYFFALRYVRPSWAFLAAIVVASNPLSLRLGVETLSETTYVFFTLLSFFILALGWDQKSSWKVFSFAGLSAGYAYVTRPEALVFIISVCVLFALVKRDWVKLSAFTMGVCLIILATSVLGYAETGKFSLTKKTSNFRILDPTDWRKNEQTKLVVRKEPTLQEIAISTMQNYGINLSREIDYASIYVGLPLGLLGLYGWARKRAFFWTAQVQFFVYPIFTALALQERFVFPYIPFLAIFAVIGMQDYISSVFKYVLAVGLLVGTISAYDFVRSPAEPFPELKAAGEILKSHVDKHSLVIDKKPYTAFYAGLKPSQFYETPNVSVEDLHKFAKQLGATHLVLAYRPTAVFRPQLMTLLTPVGQQLNIDLFKPLFSIYQGTEYEVTIFNIL
jgi:hypothetical protein